MNRKFKLIARHIDNTTSETVIQLEFPNKCTIVLHVPKQWGVNSNPVLLDESWILQWFNPLPLKKRIRNFLLMTIYNIFGREK